jgi:hypothetical protein
MPNPPAFRPAPPVRPAQAATLAAQAVDAIAESEGLTGAEAVKAAAVPVVTDNPNLNDALNKVLGPATNTKTPKKPEVEVKSRTLSEADLERLDETTLMDYPIEARSLGDDASQLIKPVDSSKALRWVYFNNGMTPNGRDKVTAMNVGRYKKWGFEFCRVEDIVGGEDALVDSIIDDGGKIINYDTVLMKIDKIRLMGHYKKNLLNSMDKVDNALGRAVRSAEGELAQTSAYSKAMATHPGAKIEFFSPAEK